MATKLILIRHGQTGWNLKRRYCGSKDANLTSQGKKEASCLYQRLKKEEICKIYSSDKRRAMQTAKIIFKGRQIKRMPDLREMRFGIFEGLAYKQIIKKYPRIYAQWIKNPFNHAIPAGEKLTDFKKRVIEGFRKIMLENRNKTIAVVSHGGPISIFINHLLKSADFLKYIPLTAAVTIIEYKNGRPKIKLLNDTSHLNG